MSGNSRMRLIVMSLLALVLLVGATACEPEVLGFYVSMVEPGTTEDGLDYDTNDILFVYPDETTPQWYKVFDGDEVGLTPKHNIQGFSFNELIFNETFIGEAGVDDIEGPVELYLTFQQASIKVPDIDGDVRGNDIVQFDGYFDGDHWDDVEYSVLFDGSDVGLAAASERLDGISVWPPEYYDLLAADLELPYDCNAGVLFLTTRGTYRVPNNQGGFLIGDGSDVLLFCAVNLGGDTAGFWFRAFDGSDAGIQPRNAGFGVDVWAISFDPEATEDSGDLDLSILFFFTPKRSFTSFCDGGDPSQLMVGGVLGEDPPQEGDCVEGPFADFNEGTSISGNEFPGVNGVVDTVGVFDFPFTEGP